MSVKAEKKCFNSLMFGGSITRWKRVWKVAKEAQSPIAEAFEREMRRARVLIADQELKRLGARAKKSNATLMSEAVSRERETKIMLKMKQETARQAWEAGTLIHDATTLQRKSIQNTPEEREFDWAVEAALSGAIVERGWPLGSARAKIAEM